MNPATDPAETAEVLEIVALANKLRPAERLKLARALLESAKPAFRPEAFNTRAELIEYLMAQPDVVIEKV